MKAKSRVNPIVHENCNEVERLLSRTIDLGHRSEHLTLQADLLSEIEREFLQRRFRYSLQLANRFIVDEISRSVISSHLETHTASVIQVGSVFSYGCVQDLSTKPLRRTFLVDVESTISPIDQVAAIALQSWHEISASQQQSQSKISGKHTTSQGYKYLLPFLDLYSSESISNCRPMPLELMVIFLEFCHAENMIQEAITASIDLLAFIMEYEVPRIPTDSLNFDDHSHEILIGHKQEVLIVFLTRLLPRLKDAELTRRILIEGVFYHQLSSSPSSSPSKSILEVSAQSTAKYDCLGSVSEICSVLKDVTSKGNMTSWWTQPVFDASKFLAQRLTDMNEGESENDCEQNMLQLYHTSDDCDNLFRSHVSPTMELRTPRQKFWMQSMGALSNQINRLVKSAIAKLLPAANSELGRDQKRAVWAGKITFSAALMLLAWRRKRLLQSFCNRAVMILLSPLTEMLEALESGPSDHLSTKISARRINHTS